MKNLYIFPELLWCSDSPSLQGWKTVKNWQAGLLRRSNKAARHCQNHARASCSHCLRFYSKNEAPMEAFGRGLLLKQLLVFKEGHGWEPIRKTHCSPLQQSHLEGTEIGWASPAERFFSLFSLLFESQSFFRPLTDLILLSSVLESYLSSSTTQRRKVRSSKVLVHFCALHDCPASSPVYFSDGEL